MATNQCSKRFVYVKAFCSLEIFKLWYGSCHQRVLNTSVNLLQFKFRNNRWMYHNYYLMLLDIKGKSTFCFIPIHTEYRWNDTTDRHTIQSIHTFISWNALLPTFQVNWTLFLFCFPEIIIYSCCSGEREQWWVMYGLNAIIVFRSSDRDFIGHVIDEYYKWILNVFDFGWYFRIRRILLFHFQWERERWLWWWWVFLRCVQLCQ